MPGAMSGGFYGLTLSAIGGIFDMPLSHAVHHLAHRRLKLDAILVDRRWGPALPRAPGVVSVTEITAMTGRRAPQGPEFDRPNDPRLAPEAATLRGAKYLPMDSVDSVMSHGRQYNRRALADPGNSPVPARVPHWRQGVAPAAEFLTNSDETLSHPGDVAAVRRLPRHQRCQFRGLS